MSDNLRTRAAATRAALSETARKEHVNAWLRVHNHVTELAGKPGAKIFEVHHAVEHARKLYLAELAKGLPADLCEKHTLAAYSPS